MSATSLVNLQGIYKYPEIFKLYGKLNAADQVTKVVMQIFEASPEVGEKIVNWKRESTEESMKLSDVTQWVQGNIGKGHRKAALEVIFEANEVAGLASVLLSEVDPGATFSYSSDTMSWVAD